MPKLLVSTDGLSRMNLVVNGSRWTERDLQLIFNGEPVVFVDNIPIPNLLVHLGIFKSMSQARQAGRTGNIPSGYTEYKASRKVHLYIWNPSQ